MRNWFVFAASERWREDDSEHEHYSDSGGKSGGQKEKLAYTILAASLAYQFGLEWGAVRSRSFRFVVIDEAFGRGSDESAQYGLQLFAQLNLQLLIVTPLQKIHIIEPFVSSVGFVHNEDGRDSGPAQSDHRGIPRGKGEEQRMNWTTPADLRAQVQKLWDRGVLLAALAGGEPLFPRRLTLKGPIPQRAERTISARCGTGSPDCPRRPAHYRVEWRDRQSSRPRGQRTSRRESGSTAWTMRWR